MIVRRGTHIIFVSFICLIIIGSCNRIPARVDRDGMVKFIADKKNGLIQESDVNGIQVKASFQPSDMLVLQELQAAERINDTVFKRELERRYGSQYYFNLKFSKNGKEAIRQLGDFNRYSEMVQVLSFRMGQFVNLTTPSKDTVDLSDYIFDQTYGMSDGNTVLLSFDKKKLDKSEILDINVGECGFGMGSIKFRFRKEDLNNVPELIYSPQTKQ